MKRLCGICSLREAQQYCKCSHEELCADAGCISRHISQSPGPHPFTSLTSKSSQSLNDSRGPLQSYDISTEVSQFIDREVMYLRHRKDELKQAIETKAIELCEEIRQMGEAKQQEVEMAFDKLLEKIGTLKSVTQKEKVRTVKWTNGHLFAMNCVFSKVRIADFAKIEAKFLLNFKEEKRFELAPVRPKQWWLCSGNVDALTIVFSKDVKLSGLSIGKQMETSPAVALESLQVLEGRSTQDREIYSHPRVSPLASTTPDRFIVRFNCTLPLYANTCYTLKVKLRGGKVTCAGPLLRIPRQEDISVSVEPTQYAGGDASNGSSTDAGVFFELFYQIAESRS